MTRFEITTARVHIILCYCSVTVISFCACSISPAAPIAPPPPQPLTRRYLGMSSSVAVQTVIEAIDFRVYIDM